MAKINIEDHLDDLLERLMDEDADMETIEKTLKISKAVVDIAKAKTDEKRLKIMQFESLNRAGFLSEDLGNDIQFQLGIKKQLTQ